MAPKPVKKGISKRKIAAGIAAATVVAAAGYYFYGSKNAKKHRAAASLWAKKLKKDAIAKTKKLETITPAVVGSVITEAAKAYQNIKKIKSEDLQMAVAELKENWKNIVAEAKKASAPKKAAKKKVPVAKKKAKKA